jgi:hypothetical protein
MPRLKKDCGLDKGERRQKNTENFGQMERLVKTVALFKSIQRGKRKEIFLSQIVASTKLICPMSEKLSFLKKRIGGYIKSFDHFRPTPYCFRCRPSDSRRMLGSNPRLLRLWH